VTKNQTTSEALRTYFNRIRGACPVLFNMAHAVTGNYDLAEYALRSALLCVWQENPGSTLGLQERLRSNVRRIAVKLAQSDRSRQAERTWNGLRVQETNPVLDQAAQESPEMRRCIVMKYGCGLSVGRIARITGLPVTQLKTAFERFEVRTRRRLPGRDRRRLDVLIDRAVSDYLERTDEFVPDAQALYRAFEAEAASVPVKSHRFARIVGSIVMILLALVCAFIFWLYAVISQPSRLEAPPDGNQTAIYSDLPNSFV